MDICMHTCGYVSVGSEIALLVVAHLWSRCEIYSRMGIREQGARADQTVETPRRRDARWCEVMQS